MVQPLAKRPRLWLQLVLSSLITLSCATGAWSRAKVFSDYSLDQAKQQAQQEGTLLLIDFTAAWCPPCKRMESETWTDDAVQGWIKENAIAVQIDVDKDEKTSSALNINSMPTLVLFTPQGGSKEFGRQVGFVTPSELLRWLEGAKGGKSADEVEKEQAQFGENAIWQSSGLEPRAFCQKEKIEESLFFSRRRKIRRRDLEGLSGRSQSCTKITNTQTCVKIVFPQGLDS